MKIGLFTDSHYCKSQLGGGRDSGASFEKIKVSMEAFKREGVDICFCLGDLTDHGPTDTKETVEKCFIEVMELINSYGIPFYLVPGNHDYLMMKAEELVEKTGYKIPPYVVSTEELDFIVLDANYRSNMIRFDIAGVEWTDSNLPPQQIEFLKKALNNSSKECVILVHENLDPNVQECHIIKNSEEVREIIKHSERVKLVLQGHYHCGANAVIDNIPYITLSAMCENKDNYYKIIST
ncbi:MAG: metallophosphoesterase [Clostridia bacterium]|nr:metallophosphoesterase [Clostridia bacterium]